MLQIRPEQFEVLEAKLRIVLEECPSGWLGKLCERWYFFPGYKTLARFNYTKRSPEDRKRLRREFDSSGRKNFLKRLAAEDPNALREAGISDRAIARMRKRGKLPKGWQVHHKKPIDDNGDNRESNLVLIKDDPAHQAVTQFGNSVISGMKPGETRTVEWPIVPGKIYPSRPDQVIVVK